MRNRTSAPLTAKGGPPTIKTAPKANTRTLSGGGGATYRQLLHTVNCYKRPVAKFFGWAAGDSDGPNSRLGAMPVSILGREPGW